MPNRFYILFLPFLINSLSSLTRNKLAKTMHALKGFFIFLVITISAFLVEDVSAGIGLKPLDFFRFKDENLIKEITVIFHPEEGIQLRGDFKKKYGNKGEDLIRSLGGGYTLETKGS